MIDYLAQILTETWKSGLLFSEVGHGLMAIPFAYFLWKKSKSPKKVAILYLATYFIDLDHLIEYFQYYGLHFDLLEFFELDFFRALGKAILPLHGWEWVLLLFFIGRRKKWKSVYWAVALGFGAHLLWDTLSNGFPAAFYFISWRAGNGFALPR